MEKLIVIVPAAGQGRRLGLGHNKAFALVQGVPLLVRCLAMLAATELVAKAVVVVASGEITAAKKLLKENAAQYFPELPWTLVIGGKERQDSVAHALAVITEPEGWVAVHDGARPFAGREVFARTWEAAKEYGAAIAAVPVKNTIKIVDARGWVVSTPERSTLRDVQTPQIFDLQLLRQAYRFLAEHPQNVTDDASLVEALGHRVAVALGSYENIKVTTPDDLLLAEKIIQQRQER